jgi:hypothetical protein
MVGWIVYALLALLSVAIIMRSPFFKLKAIRPTTIVSVYLIKLGVGFIFLWVYSDHYQTGSIPPDAIRYVNDAYSIAELLPERTDVFNALILGYSLDDPLYDSLSHRIVGWQSGYLYGLTNDCVTMIRLNVPIAILSQGFFPIHALIFSFISFIGLFLLFKAFLPYLNKNSFQLAYLGIHLLPTPLFWTCAPTKEAALMPVFGGVIYILSQWHQNKWKSIYWVYLIPIILGLAFIKQYVFFALIPSLLFLLIHRLLKSKHISVTWIFTMTGCYVIAQSAHLFFIGGDFLYVLGKKLTDFSNVARLQNAGSFIHVPHSNNTGEFLLHFPEALSLTYLRPYFWECKSFIYLPFIAENLIFVLLLLWTATHYLKPKVSTVPFLLFALGVILTLAAIIGNTVPILGATIRYRTPGLLLLWLVCLAVAQVPRALSHDQSN